MALTLRIIFGLVFIASGALKLYPIEPFEYEFVSLGVSSWTLSPFIARLAIAGEFAVGVMIIANLHFRKLILPASSLMLIGFSAYLLHQLATEGNNVNCGCFGSFISMTPMQALTKNVFLGAILFVLYRINKPHNFKPWWLTGIVLLAASATPYILNPVAVNSVQAKEIDEPLSLRELPPPQDSLIKLDFSTGKHIVAFFSPHCLHCKNAARKLSVIADKAKLPAIVAVMNGSAEEILSFKEETRSSFPTIQYEGGGFFKLSGAALPAIVYLEDGILRKKWTSDLFDVAEFEQLADSPK